MTFSNPPTQPSRENSILILKASLKVINHDKNDSLYFIFIQYASQFCIYFSTSIAEVNYYIFKVIQKVSELFECFTTAVVKAKMSANVCIHVEKIGKQPGVRINRHSTESSVSQLWLQHTLYRPLLTLCQSHHSMNVCMYKCMNESINRVFLEQHILR